MSHNRTHSDLPTVKTDPLRDTILALVQAIRPHDPLEVDHLAQTVAWLQSGAPLFRMQKPATPPQHLVAYFVVIDPASQLMLLGDHKDAGLWLPSGGHVEPDEHPRQTAAREAQEELGLIADFIWPEPIFLTVTATKGLSAGHTDVSLWFVLRGDATAELTYEVAEFHAVAWFPFDQLPVDRCEPHLERFVTKLQTLLVAV